MHLFGHFFCKTPSVWRNLRYHWPEWMGNVIDFRKFYDIITAFRCGSTVRDVSAVDFCKAKEKMIDES